MDFIIQNHRISVIIAAIAVFFWAKTGPGIIHSLAYNIMFVASVSTVIFNINPLMRFDGVTSCRTCWRFPISTSGPRRTCGTWPKPICLG